MARRGQDPRGHPDRLQLRDQRRAPGQAIPPSLTSIPSGRYLRWVRGGEWVSRLDQRNRGTRRQCLGDFSDRAPEGVGTESFGPAVHCGVGGCPLPEHLDRHAAEAAIPLVIGRGESLDYREGVLLAGEEVDRQDPDSPTAPAATAQRDLCLNMLEALDVVLVGAQKDNSPPDRAGESTRAPCWSKPPGSAGTWSGRGSGNRRPARARSRGRIGRW